MFGCIQRCISFEKFSVFLFLKLWCVCFEKCFEIDAFVSATIVMTRVWVSTKVCVFFEKMFQMFFESLFWKVLVECGLKSRQVFLQVDQVTKSLSTPNLLKGFSHVLTLFNNFVPPLYLVDNLTFRMFNGTCAGHRMDHECNGAKCLWKFAWRDYDHFDRRLSNALNYVMIRPRVCMQNKINQ